MKPHELEKLGDAFKDAWSNHMVWYNLCTAWTFLVAWINVLALGPWTWPIFAIMFGPWALTALNGVVYALRSRAERKALKRDKQAKRIEELERELELI